METEDVCTPDICESWLTFCDSAYSEWSFLVLNKQSNFQSSCNIEQMHPKLHLCFARCVDWELTQDAKWAHMAQLNAGLELRARGATHTAFSVTGFKNTAFKPLILINWLFFTVFRIVHRHRMLLGYRTIWDADISHDWDILSVVTASPSSAWISE